MNNTSSSAALLALYDPEAIGIRTLASYAKEKAGFKINQIYFKDLFPGKYPYSEKDMALLISLIRELNPKILGISLRSSSLNTAKDIIRRVRKEIEKIVIVIGGTHAIICPEECIVLADVVCTGEGEKVFLEVLERFDSTIDSIKGIEGTWIRDKTNIYKNPISELMDVDTLPVIDYSDQRKWYIENNQVIKGDPLSKNTVGEIFSSRGCPFHCTYCTNNILKGILHKGKFVRLKSVENTMRDILNSKKQFPDLKKIVFADEVFALKQKWAKEFCIKYKEQIRLPFAALFNPNMVNAETVNLLKDAGLVHARMGIQAGSEKVRKEMYKRNESDNKIRQAAGIFHKAGIRLTFDLIVNNPFESEKDLEDALNFLLSIERPFELNLHSLVYFPKTELTRMALEKGVIQPRHVEGAADEALRLNHVLLKDKQMIYDYPDNLFWNSLFSLTSKSFLPPDLIKRLAQTAFLKNHPEWLLYLSKLSNSVNIFLIGMGMLKNREISLNEVVTAAKQFKLTLSVNK